MLIESNSQPLTISSIALALYNSFVWTSFIYLNINDEAFIALLMFILLTVISFFAFYNVLPKLNSYNIKYTNADKHEKIFTFVLYFGCALITLLLWYKVAYPGFFSPDSEAQYAQAISGEYNDWHPVWHTLLFFTLPMKLFSNRASIVLLQIIYFSLIMGYFALTIRELSNPIVTVICFLLVILNPCVLHINMYAWKDVGFADAGLLAIIIAIRIVAIRKKAVILWQLVLLAFATVCATLFRHNGVLFTLPLVIYLLFSTPKKLWLKYILCVAMMMLIIKVPIYKSINVENPDKRVTETMGLPLTIIGNSVVENLDQMDDEFQDFVLSIAPVELWEDHYECGNFNSIKFTGLIDTKPIEEKGYLGILKETWKCFKKSPKASLKALFSLTDVVYGIENGLESDIGIFPYEYPKYSLESILFSYSNFIDYSCFKYIRTYGVYILCILIVAFSKLYSNFALLWKKCVIVLPIILYDFGTMLLLTGPDARFFHITFLVVPIVIVYLLSERDVII